MGEQYPVDVGIVYVATGDAYRRMLEYSLRSVLQHEPGARITAVVDFSRDLAHTFPAVEFIELDTPSFTWDDKIEGLKLSPYEKTIYLDVDVVARAPFIPDLLNGLKHVDLLIRPGMSFNLEWESRYGYSIDQFNSGVIAYNRAPMQPVLAHWQSLRAQDHRSHDQPTLRRAILESSIRFAPLSADFNFMGHDAVVHLPRLVHFAGAFRRYGATHRQRASVAKRLGWANSGDQFIFGRRISSGSPRLLSIILVWLVLLPRRAYESGIGRKAFERTGIGPLAARIRDTWRTR